MLNLNSTIDLDVKCFLRWWRRELSFLVPQTIKSLWEQAQSFIIIKASEHEWQLSYQCGMQLEPLAVLQRNKSAISDYQSLLENNTKLRKANVILRLTAEQAMQRELMLPVVAKENLRQVITYELDRYTPFKADQAYFDIHYLPKQASEPDQVKVLLILTPRTVFNTLCQELKEIGIVPSSADFEGVVSDLEHNFEPYNLMPEWLRPKVAKTPQLIQSGLMILSLVLLIAVLVTPVWFEYQAVKTLTQKAKKLEKEATEIKNLQQEVNAIIEETQQLIDEKNTAPSMVAALNSLSKLMNNNTWLAYLQYTNKQLQIQGTSNSASSLIAALEDAPEFNKPTFVSPVTQDSVSKQEHFQIMVELSKKPDAQ